MLPDLLPGHRQRDATYWRAQRHQDQIFARLDFCNGLRNRVAHHEPLWKAGHLLEERRNRAGNAPVAVAMPAPATEAEALARLVLSYERVQELLNWLNPALLRVHKKSEAHFHLAALLSPRAIAYYKRMAQTDRLDLTAYRKLSDLKKRFRQLQRKGMPVHIRRNGDLVGYWVNLPT